MGFHTFHHSLHQNTIVQLTLQLLVISGITIWINLILQQYFARIYDSCIYDFSVVIEVCLQENIISVTLLKLAIVQFLSEFQSKFYTNFFVCLQAHSISVFLLQNVMFNSMCYLLFLCNYLWNLLAISRWKLFQSKIYSSVVNYCINNLKAHLTFDWRYVYFLSFKYSFNISAGVIKQSHLTFNIFQIVPKFSRAKEEAETCQGLPWRSSSSAGRLGGWMQSSKLWTLKGRILHFCSMSFLPAAQL